ncbi:hypothetical protein ACFQRL_13320 [Microbacterium fluvii]|uniref:Uncharacterized protein n=1 Tax=Microbacterium fluvii TaxID=415215 RepID=A0ABW2HF74_9MICO|nr:hypothetical protein [Microbacterium fluvii]MCU4673570.1 hypothetical protein [Microbacterium fluvii]
MTQFAPTPPWPPAVPPPATGIGRTVVATTFVGLAAAVTFLSASMFTWSFVAAASDPVEGYVVVFPLLFGLVVAVPAVVLALIALVVAVAAPMPRVPRIVILSASAFMIIVNVLMPVLLFWYLTGP